MGANLPPTSGIRVPPEALRRLVHACFDRAGMRDADARLMADLLVATDLRGVHSHGTRQTVGYVRTMRDGRVNPRPNIEERETTTTTRIYDGDGGMGHLPSWRAACFVADTAELPGGLEWRREQDYARDGIPVAPDHQESLQALADELGLEVPFAHYEGTRFGAA